MNGFKRLCDGMDKKNSRRPRLYYFVAMTKLSELNMSPPGHHIYVYFVAIIKNKAIFVFVVCGIFGLHM